jgi:hypothetical protein
LNYVPIYVGLFGRRIGYDSSVSITPLALSKSLIRVNDVLANDFKFRVNDVVAFTI